MKYEQWKSERRFLEIDVTERLKLITGIIIKYLLYRNIEQQDNKIAVIVEAVNKELLYLPYLKPLSMRWALFKYTDATVNNISAALIIDYLRKGYNHEIHKDILKQWHKDETENRIPETTDSSIDEKKQKSQNRRLPKSR